MSLCSASFSSSSFSEMRAPPLHWCGCGRLAEPHPHHPLVRLPIHTCVVCSLLHFRTQNPQNPPLLPLPHADASQGVGHSWASPLPHAVVAVTVKQSPQRSPEHWQPTAPGRWLWRRVVPACLFSDSGSYGSGGEGLSLPPPWLVSFSA